MAGRFLGIGVDEYVDDALPNLEHAVSDVQAFQVLLGGHFAGEPLANPDAQSVRDGLSALTEPMSEQPGSLVLMWAGHGVPSLSVGLRLPARDSHSSKDEGFDVNGDLGSASGLSGASQILLIVDTCYSGKAVSAANVVGTIMQAQPRDAAYVWVGVLASCQTLATAQDGLFGRTLNRVLREGPSIPELKLRWSTQNEFIRGDDLCDAILKEWDGDAQKPQFEGNGSAWWMFPNPLYRPNAPEQIVEHLLLAARGGTQADERSWFTGRTVEVDRVVEWVLAGEASMHVVTGSAGSGKSAIVGRVVSLSNPQERERLLSEGHGWSHSDPGIRSVHAHVHARGLTADRAADLLGEALVRCGVLAAQPERRNSSELVGQVQRAVESGIPPPVVVVDGLDEARGEAFSIAEDLLTRLAEDASVVVCTRELPRGDGRGSLIATLTPQGAQLDLDDSSVRERGRTAIRDYIAARLDNIDERMDGTAIAEYFVEQAAAARDGLFLLARLATDRLRERPIDTSLPDWRRQVGGSIDDALDVDLARVAPRRAAADDDDLNASDAARGLLSALTWGLGAGLPEDEWLAIVSALMPEVAMDRDDITWVLDELGRYVVQDGEDGVAVYRMAHQSLADHMRAPYRGTRERPFDPEALPIAQALLDRYKTLLDGGVDVLQPAYLWRYAWHHAALAGPSGLDLLRRLAERARELIPDVATAATVIAGIADRGDSPLDAVAPLEEALNIYRTLSREDDAFRGDFAVALSNLSSAYSKVGRLLDAVELAEESLDIYRQLVADNPALMEGLAATLTNLGRRYAAVGRPLEAVGLTEEALRIYRELAAENPAYLEDLAMTLNNLGGHYGNVGRPLEVVAPIEEAVRIYRTLAMENPAFQGDFAGTLNNLSNAYAGIGRRLEATAPGEEALGIYRSLAANNPAFLGDLAMTLNNLGGHYGSAGRPLEALALVEEALGIYRLLAANNPAFLGDLAMTLNNLGSRYGFVGRRLEAVAPIEEAVRIYRTLAAENPAFQGDLAGTLDNLGRCYGEVGRPQDAVALVEEALNVYRTLAADNPAFQGKLALVLNNLSNRYGEVSRPLDSITLLLEALGIYRALAAENPAFKGDLAMALNNLGGRYAIIGHPLEAVAPVEEALGIYRELVAENPALRGDQAGTLNNLGNVYSAVDRPLEAIAPAEEALDIYRELAAENPAFQGDLAMTLNNLSNRYGAVDRSLEGIAPAEEALGICRELVAENPAYMGNLAMTLNNLGRRYGEVGRSLEGIAPAEEALGIARELAAKNPAYVKDLATTLNSLIAHCQASGEPERAEAYWAATLAYVDSITGATLMMDRAHHAGSGDPHAVEWLASALSSAGDSRGLLVAIHNQARRHRNADAIAFDELWERHAGEAPPAWLTVEDELVTLARAWIETKTYADERDHLAAHPQLLEDAADIAVEEALLEVADDNAKRYAQLRALARTHGIEEAYAPLLQRALAARFVASDTGTQRALLAEHREVLLGEIVTSTMGALAEDERDGRAQRGLALLVLAASGDDAAVFAALEDPSRFPALLSTLAERPNADALAPASFLAYTAAATSAQIAEAWFFMAVAAAIAEDDNDAIISLLSRVRATDPAGVPERVTQLAQLAARHPTLLPLIARLAQPPDDEESAPSPEARDPN